MVESSFCFSSTLIHWTSGKSTAQLEPNHRKMGSCKWRWFYFGFGRILCRNGGLTNPFLKDPLVEYYNVFSLLVNSLILAPNQLTLCLSAISSADDIKPLQSVYIKILICIQTSDPNYLMFSPFILIDLSRHVDRIYLF